VERVPLPEAARRLGVSEMTVRRRLKAGSLTGEQEVTPQGYRWWIYLPAGAQPSHEPSNKPEGADEVVRLNAEIARLHERLAEANQLVLMAQQGQLRAQETLATVLRLQAPQDTTATTAPSQVVTPAAQVSRRRWWKR